MTERANPPKTFEQIVASLPQEIKLIGGYLVADIESANILVDIRQKELDKLVADPIEAELDLEEESEALGLTRKETREAKQYDLNEENIARELQNAIQHRDQIIGLLKELSQGQYERVIKYLERHLDAALAADRLAAKMGAKLSPAYREKQDAKKRGLVAYIDILKQKAAGT